MATKIGTRGSKLALKQVDIVVEELGISDYEVVIIKTEGDRRSKEGKTQFDKLNFVEAIENKLIAGDIDIAVHSAKDMPAKDNPKLKNSYLNEMVNSATADNWNKDLLIFKNGMEKIFSKDLKLGTSSLRRKMQAKFYLGAERIHNLNGNIDTRINKLNSGEYDCIVLAKAGYERLGYNLNSIELDHLTSTGQGIICIQTRDDFNKLDFESSKSIINEQLINLQKEFLKHINADCNSALALKITEDHTSQNFKLDVEIYGQKEKLKFSTYGQNCVEEAVQMFHKSNGEIFLNEHN